MFEAKSYRVDCDVTFTPPRGERESASDEVQIGVLYSAQINTVDKIVNTKIALSDGGLHQGILDNLFDTNKIEGTNETNTIPICETSSDESAKNYLIWSSASSEPRHEHFKVAGLNLVEEQHDNEAIILAAALGIRALMLANKNYSSLLGKTHVSWGASQLESVPDDCIYTE